jgi:sugar phosphate isomerase/epimerase
MIVAGKCPPTADELRAASDRGFDAVELHLSTDDLDAMEETTAVCRAAPVEVVSMHTPHVDLDELEYVQRANDLCERLDATLVVHSTKIPLSNIDRVLDRIDITVPHGFENSTGHSLHFVRNVLFDEGRSLVLDTAHLYTAEEAYCSILEDLLAEYGNSIPVVHCCDGTKLTDGLAFGTGTMDMERVMATLHENYDGILVLEVMPDEQEDALEMWRGVTRQG